MNKYNISGLILPTMSRLYHNYVRNVLKNIFLANYYMYQYKNKKLSTVYLETTNACNLNCVICPTQRENNTIIKHGFMSPKFFNRLVDEIARESPYINVFLHKDGEPLLHPNIIDFLGYACSKLKNVTLVTNATLVNGEMAKAILNTNLQNIKFSVDGITKNTYEKIRIQSKDNPYTSSQSPVDYETVISNILNFCNLKKELKSKIRVCLRMTNFKMSNTEITNYRSFWEKRVDSVEIAGFHSWSGEIYKEKKEHLRYPCLHLWRQSIISWNGTMVPCCTYIDFANDGKGFLANINNINIKDAFFGSVLLNMLRRAHIDNNLDEIAPFCKNCDDWRVHYDGLGNIWTKKMKKALRPEN